MICRRIPGGLATVLFTALSLHTAAADDGWLHEFDEAVAAARQEGKDILIDFSGTDWCVPCKQLWTHTLSQPEFIQSAVRHFALLEIDNLAREAMPEGRKQRYDALQEKFGIQAFPTVVLTTAEGLPYAVTGLVDEINNPAAYWRHLEPLRERGQKFKSALAAAGGAEGLTTAETIVAALSELRPDFVLRFYAGKLNRLRELAPSDETGYLAFIDARAALSDLESRLQEGFLAGYDEWSEGKTVEAEWIKKLSPADVDALIEKHRLGGASLREALVARLLLEIDAKDWRTALRTLDAIAGIDAPLSRFEEANFAQFVVRSPDELRRNVEAAGELSAEPLSQLRVLYGIVKDDLDCVTLTSSCNYSFTVKLHQIRAGAAYGQLLLDTTAHLQGEERAIAIGKGLEGIELFANGPIGRVVRELMPELVGKEAAIKFLPPRYADWLRD